MARPADTGQKEVIEMSEKRSGKRASGLIDPTDCVLVVIDVQEKLLPVMHEKDKILDNVVRLVRFAKIIDLPVVVTEQENLGPTLGDIAGEVPGFDQISKIDFDATRCSEFVERLKKIGRKAVIIAGIESHVCITQTVLSLLPDYDVHVVSDAVSSRTRENLDVAFGRMGAGGAVISSTEMVIFELLKRAGTDEFREALRLVK